MRAPNSRLNPSRLAALKRHPATLLGNRDRRATRPTGHRTIPQRRAMIHVRWELWRVGPLTKPRLPSTLFSCTVSRTRNRRAAQSGPVVDVELARTPRQPQPPLSRRSGQSPAESGGVPLTKLALGTGRLAPPHSSHYRVQSPVAVFWIQTIGGSARGEDAQCFFSYEARWPLRWPLLPARLSCR